MPIGSFVILPYIMLAAQQQQPKTILDVGIGYGIYGPAFRQWLDMGVKPYKTTIHGIEGFENYQSAAWQEYDAVYVQDIAQFETGGKYDLIVFTDVIEHFDKVKGYEVVNKLKGFLAPGGVLLIGTPAVWIPQDAVHGNNMECHRSLWTLADFADCTVIMDGTPLMEHRMILVKYTKPI